jgi:hypothetical protein
MSLMTYAEVRPWARSIKARVTTRRCVAHRSQHRQYASDPSLSDKVDLIAQW